MDSRHEDYQDDFRNERPGRPAFVASAVLHAGALLLAWWTTTTAAAPMEFEVVEINLVSPPPAVTAEVVQPPAPEEELVVETPVTQPEPEEVVEDEIPPPPEEPEPEETPPPEPEEEPPPEPEEEEPPEEQPEEAPEPDLDLPPEEPTAEEPAEEAEESGEDIDIRVAGVQRDYPEYYNNIVLQMQRCFRWREPGPTGMIQFVIQQDGTVDVGSIEVVQPSGNVAFDFEMMGAAECASGRLGVLPDGYPFPTLPIRFNFRAPESDETEAASTQDPATPHV